MNAIGCPFMSYRPGQSLLPDDACRPNIIGRDDGAVNGYADPGEIGLGDVEVDLPSAVWTCQYNLAPGSASHSCGPRCAACGPGTRPQAAHLAGSVPRAVSSAG